MKICAGTIIWKSTRAKQIPFPLKFRRPSAYPARVAVSTAHTTLKKIIRSVFLYSRKKFILVTTSVKLSVIHSVGKITKGFTCVDSVTVLKAVRIIQINGTSMVIEARIKKIWITTRIVFSLGVISNPPLSYNKPISSGRSSGIP